MTEVTSTTIDLLRHGEPEGGEIFRGTTDVELNERGWQQMNVATRHELEAAPWHKIYSSPLKRCAEFASQLASDQGVEIETAKALQEIYFGEWEGQLVADVQKEDHERLQAFWGNPEENPPPGGEKPLDAFHRANAFLDSILETSAGQHLLVVSHGGIIRLLLLRALDMPLSAMAKISVPYACLSRLQVFQAEGREPWMQLVSHYGSLQRLDSVS